MRTYTDTYEAVLEATIVYKCLDSLIEYTNSDLLHDCIDNVTEKLEKLEYELEEKFTLEGGQQLKNFSRVLSDIDTYAYKQAKRILP
jgi:hypothetical protein